MSKPQAIIDKTLKCSEKFVILDETFALCYIHPHAILIAFNCQARVFVWLQVRAHKLVLSACSAFFRRLLRRNPGPNPVIVLWDVAFSDLINIVDFMYNGEVKVRQANIQSFLAVAEKFRVRGLCQNESSSSNNGHSGKQPIVRQTNFQQQHLFS